MDIYARHEKLPAGFIRRRATMKSSPYPDMELMIKTKEGLGSSGETQARLHDWKIPSDKMGGIVGYRLVRDPANPKGV
jgi:hypothetical protein